jgi:GntR family transcriptional regulator, rspAB operon transcriptional repressor
VRTSEPAVHQIPSSGGKRKSLTETAYEKIRSSILSGEYPVGTVLAEGTIAENFGSSKTPVRQALQLLRTEGLLEVGYRRQLIVRGFTPEHRNEVLQVREALELIAIRAACTRMTIEEIDDLQTLLRRQKRAAVAADEDEFLRLDEEFHILIAQGANLPIVARLLQQMRGFARVMRLGRSQPPEHFLEVQAEHERIVDALERRDVELAERSLYEHLHHWDYLLGGNDEPELTRAG